MANGTPQIKHPPAEVRRAGFIAINPFRYSKKGEKIPDIRVSKK